MSTKWGSQEGDYPSDMWNDQKSTGWDFSWEQKTVRRKTVKPVEPPKPVEPQCSRCLRPVYSFYCYDNKYYNCAACFVGMCDVNKDVVTTMENAARHRMLYLCAQRELEAAGMTAEQVKEQISNFIPDLANKC